MCDNWQQSCAGKDHRGRQTVAHLLAALGDSLPANRKTKEGTSHPDRNAQFAYINTRVRAFQKRGYPVVSVETKKKELVGDFNNGGQEWRPQGQPERVRVYDFVDEDLGKAIPYGVYDQAANMGWVNVGVDHGTAAFAVESRRRWWEHMGSQRYPRAPALLITADGGGSNGSRNRLWKVACRSWPMTLACAWRSAISPQDQPMEQDRTSDVQSYEHELARPPADQP